MPGNATGSVLVCFMVFILSAAWLAAPDDVEGSEFRFQPTLVLSEEYNDNVFLTPENGIDDYITTVSPSLHLLYNAPFWDWDVDYKYLYRYYADTADKTDSSHTLSLANRNRIIKDVLFLNVRDDYTRVSLDVTRDYTQESNVVNQSDRNIVTVNPYFVLRPTSQMTVTAGYSYLSTWYRDPAAVDSTDHIGAVDLTQDLSPRSSVIAGFKYTYDENNLGGYTRDDVYLGQHYEYADNSMITATIGNSWFDFERTARATQVFWDVVVTHRYPTVTISYETGLRNIPDPLRGLRREDRYVVTIRRDVERTSLLISGGIREYRDAEFKHLENTSYRLNGAVSHAVTTTSKILLDLTTERLVDNRTGADIDRYLTGVRYEYVSMENLTLALDYRYTNVYSPDVYAVNYFNNRFTVELRKVF